jgi:hypothetical protein
MLAGNGRDIGDGERRSERPKARARKRRVVPSRPDATVLQLALRDRQIKQMSSPNHTATTATDPRLAKTGAVGAVG